MIDCPHCAELLYIVQLSVRNLMDQSTSCFIFSWDDALQAWVDPGSDSFAPTGPVMCYACEEPLFGLTEGELIVDPEELPQYKCCAYAPWGIWEIKPPPTLLMESLL